MSAYWRNAAGAPCRCMPPGSGRTRPDVIIFRRFSPFAPLERIKRQKTERRTVMDNNNKSFEELADEALDKVAGGGSKLGSRDTLFR